MEKLIRSRVKKFKLLKFYLVSFRNPRKPKIYPSIHFDTKGQADSYLKNNIPDLSQVFSIIQGESLRKMQLEGINFKPFNRVEGMVLNKFSKPKHVKDINAKKRFRQHARREMLSNMKVPDITKDILRDMVKSVNVFREYKKVYWHQRAISNPGIRVKTLIILEKYRNPKTHYRDFNMLVNLARAITNLNPIIYPYNMAQVTIAFFNIYQERILSWKRYWVGNPLKLEDKEIAMRELKGIGFIPFEPERGMPFKTEALITSVDKKYYLPLQLGFSQKGIRKYKREGYKVFHDIGVEGYTSIYEIQDLKF